MHVYYWYTLSDRRCNQCHYCKGHVTRVTINACYWTGSRSFIQITKTSFGYSYLKCTWIRSTCDLQCLDLNRYPNYSKLGNNWIGARPLSESILAYYNCTPVQWNLNRNSQFYSGNSIQNVDCKMTAILHHYQCHDDVNKWKHFPRYWPFVRGIHRSPVDSPHKGRWRGALMISLIYAWTNGWANNRDAVALIMTSL